MRSNFLSAVQRVSLAGVFGDGLQNESFPTFCHMELWNPSLFYRGKQILLWNLQQIHLLHNSFRGDVATTVWGAEGAPILFSLLGIRMASCL